MSTLTVSDIQAFRPAQVRSLTDTQITSLSPTQVQAFTPRQLATLSAPQLQTLDVTQVQALQPQQLSGLPIKQVAAFSPTQLGSMSRPQAVALMRNRANLLNTGQSTLTTAQRAALNEVLSSTVSTSNATVSSTPNGILPVTVVGAAASKGLGVKFDAQGNSAVKLQMADSPVSTSVASNRLVARYTTIEARNANNETVQFRGAIIDNRLVIAAGSASARQMARTELPSVLSSAMDTLGAGSSIAIDGLKGVVLNMR